MKGTTSVDPDRRRFWPEQCVRHGVAWAAALIVVLATLSIARDQYGSDLLGAPADAFGGDYPARPEWYFLFLFQGLKHFEGPVMEVLGAIVLPGLLVVAVLALPFFERVIPGRWGHRACAIGVCGLTLGGIFLTAAAVSNDRKPPDDVVASAQERQAAGIAPTETERLALSAHAFHRKRQRAARLAERAVELANENGIPPEGPLLLLATDPQTQGPALFARHCATCHRFHGHDGLGEKPSDPATSSDLGGFATREWIRGLLEDPMSEHYFGLMRKSDGEPAHTKMAKWSQKIHEANDSDHDRRILLGDLDAVAAYLEDESRNPGRIADRADAEASGTDERLLRGRAFFESVCNECHSYAGERTGTTRAPEMRGYGSVEWTERMIAAPDHDTRYRSRGREPAQMPPFRDRLTELERRMVAEWLHAESSP